MQRLTQKLNSGCLHSHTKATSKAYTHKCAHIAPPVAASNHPTSACAFCFSRSRLSIELPRWAYRTLQDYSPVRLGLDHGCIP